MLKDGEKGAVLQVDRETYAVAPHTPCGVVTPELLRKIAEVAEKYDVKQIKITSAYRIALFGIREEHVDRVWEELGLDRGRLTGMCVRSVRCCVGKTWCRLGQRDSMSLGEELDRVYHGMELVNKMKIAVSGCPVDCAEAKLRDLGLVAQGKKMWVMYAGGNVGSRPRIAKEIMHGLDDREAYKAVEAAVEFYKQNAKRGERIGKVMERLGPEPLSEWVSKKLALED